MSRLPVLSGRDLVKILKKAGFVPVRQKGSHIILEKSNSNPRKALVVPNYKEIDTGTLMRLFDKRD